MVNKKRGVTDLRDRFQNFMYGRYGADQLSRFLSVVALIALILTVFIRIPLLNVIALALLVWCYFRMFSRNTSKRYAENEKFLNMTSRLAGRFRSGRVHWEQRKIYKYFSCPQCKQKVRVPRGKGKICITCPKCRMEFIRKS